MYMQAHSYPVSFGDLSYHRSKTQCNHHIVLTIITNVHLISLNEDFMVTRTREILQCWESSNPSMTGLGPGILVRPGQKWKAAEAVEVTGLGSSTKPLL